MYREKKPNTGCMYREKKPGYVQRKKNKIQDACTEKKNLTHLYLYILYSLKLYCNQKLIVFFYNLFESYTHYPSNVSPNHVNTVKLIIRGHHWDKEKVVLLDR